MKHRGEIVRMRIGKSGLSIAEVYERYPKPKNTFLAWLEQPDLSWDKIWRIGQIIGWDFREDFMELRKMKFNAAEGVFEFNEQFEEYASVEFRELVINRFNFFENRFLEMEKAEKHINTALSNVIETLQRIVKALEIK